MKKDIENHVFNDENLSFSHALDDDLVFTLQVETSKRSGCYESTPLTLNKSDSIAIAKSFDDNIADINMEFKKGDTFRMPKGKSTQKCHVVEIIECNMVVYKYYGKNQQWWHYKVDHADHLKRMNEIALEIKSL
jgi:hypothetical protein